MASSSQHRCVFVGNIPYDATEEQLVDICREVGPVVSFRLVIDRETGKPKGYGFCEYKDEETALSARRNLQGYEINGRQLRVDFAENDKNTDRNREQGRGGPGLAADLQKQVRGGPAIFGESGQHQPIGLHIAITAATVMAGALGGSQASALSNPHSLQSQSALASDPLTLHLAKMSRSQLNEMISELKAMATQNREAARQLLIGRPQLSKALFQAQIMLGMVTPQVLQMPNIRQPLDQSVLPFLQETQQAQQPAIQILPGLAPLIQSVQSGLVPRMQEGQFSALPQHSLVRSHLSAPMQHSMQPRIQISQPVINHIPHQAALLGQSGVPPLHPSVRPKIHLANHSSLNQPAQASLLQQRGLVAAFGSNSQTTVPPNPAMQSLLLPRPFTPDASFQPGPSISSGISGPVNKDAAISARIPDNPSVNLQTSTVRDSKEVSSRPSKLFKLDDDKSTSFSMAGSNVSTAIGTGPSEAFLGGSVPPNLAKPEELQYSEKQSSQLTPDMESALLQQVLNLTPEQLNSLPPEQQQQVIQLQQALRGGQLRPS